MAKEISSKGQEQNAQSSIINARRRLYCYETMKNVMPNSSSSDQYQTNSLASIYSHEERSRSTCTKTMTTLSQDPEFSEKNHGLKNNKRNKLQNTSDHSKWTTESEGHKKGKYVKGLFHQFTKHHNGVYQRLESSHDSEKSGTSSLPETWTAAPADNEQEVPDNDVILEDEETSMEDNEDVLVIYDNIMTSTFDSDSGSDIDWSSLTPPVPGSPSDQRVPELEDDTEKDACFGYKGNRQDEGHLETLFSNNVFGFDRPAPSRNFQTYSASSADHVVPQFFDHR